LLIFGAVLYEKVRNLRRIKNNSMGSSPLGRGRFMEKL